MADPMAGPPRDELQRSDGSDVEPPVSSSWVVEPDVRIPALLGASLTDPQPAVPARADAEATIVEAYETWQRDIHGFLRAATRDSETAEDLTQETFIRLVREVRAGRTPDNVRAWLYTVASHLVTSRGRRLAVAERFKAIIALRGAADSPESDTLRHEQRDEVQRALRHLAPDARTAILLAAHGFSGQEVARVLGRTDGATRTLLCRARLRLREHLEAAGVGPGTAGDPGRGGTGDERHGERRT